MAATGRFLAKYPHAIMDGHRLVQAGKHSVDLLGSTVEIEAAHEELDRRHCIKLSGFLAPDLLDEIRADLQEAPFRHNIDPTRSVSAVVVSGALFMRLLLMANDDRIRGVVSSLAGIPSPGFYGRVYRRFPGDTNYWHSDCIEDRALALSVNLSDGGYGGGALEIRSVDAPDRPSLFTNDVPGDAILFRIRADLEHRQGDVTGTVPKVAYAGWYRRGAPFRSLCRSVE